LKIQYFKHFFNYFIIIFLIFSSINIVKCQDFINNIIIDPGHGGKDPGNLGTKQYGLTEKDIVLNISLLLGDMLSENFPEVNVIYTRNKDVFIPLHERTKMANSLNGDLFVSIHCNWWKNEQACGVETYVMGLSKFDDNLDIVKKENSVIYLENNYSQNYDGFDPESTESLIALTLYQDHYFNNSLVLSNKIQSKLIEATGSRDRGVKQAPFWVISRVNMPSVLIEIGFLTCPQEEKYLNSEIGQQNIANSIFEAISEYKSIFEEETSVKDSLSDKLLNKDSINLIDTVKEDFSSFLFAIQLGAFSQRNNTLESKLNDFDIKFEVINDQNLYKYFVFHSNDKKYIEKKILELIDLEFKDSFLKLNKNIKR